MRSIEADRGSRELSAALIDEAKLRKLGSDITQRALTSLRTTTAQPAAFALTDGGALTLPRCRNQFE